MCLNWVYRVSWWHCGLWEGWSEAKAWSTYIGSHILCSIDLRYPWSCNQGEIHSILGTNFIMDLAGANWHTSTF